MTQPQGARAPVDDEHMEGLKDTLGALNKEVLEEVGYEVGDLGCVQRLARKALSIWARV